MPCCSRSVPMRFIPPKPAARFIAGLKRISLTAALTFLCLAPASCSLTRLIPIQLVRVHQTESYIQYFTFPALNQDPVHADGGARESAVELLSQRIDEVFKELLGKQNWQNIKDLYGFGTIHEELLQQKIYVKGLVNLILYIDPLEQDHFLIEGMGRFYLVREKTNEIMLSGDFHIPLARHWLEELDTGTLLIDVQLYVTRIPEVITYLNETSLIYELAMDTHLKDDRIYSVDYTKQHIVYLQTGPKGSKPGEGDAIAILELQNPYPEAKLIDLRGMQFLRDDYKYHSR